MTVEEFSNEFDVLLNSYSSSRPFGLGQSPLELDEYEKSVLLTEAQEQLVKELYRGDTPKGSFEETEELRRSLDSLIKTDELLPDSTASGTYFTVIYTLPEDVWFITYESVLLDSEDAGCWNEKEIKVVPVTQDEWHSVKNNPFRKPSKRRVIRLDKGNLTVELISFYNLGKYTVRYLAKPSPIILADLEGTEIDGNKNISSCSLNTIMHRPILERAVQLAVSRIPRN